MWLRKLLLRLFGSAKQKTQVESQQEDCGTCPVCGAPRGGEGDARTYFEFWCTNSECDYTDRQFT